MIDLMSEYVRCISIWVRCNELSDVYFLRVTWILSLSRILWHFLLVMNTFLSQILWPLVLETDTKYTLVFSSHIRYLGLPPPSPHLVQTAFLPPGGGAAPSVVLCPLVNVFGGGGGYLLLSRQQANIYLLPGTLRSTGTLYRQAGRRP